MATRRVLYVERRACDAARIAAAVYEAHLDWDVAYVASVGEALDVLCSRPFDAVVVPVGLPGSEVLHELEAARPKVPVFAVHLPGSRAAADDTAPDASLVLGLHTLDVRLRRAAAARGAA